MFFSIKYTHGFTLIETLMGILLTALTCSAFFFGITQGRLYLDSIKIKEKAFLLLENKTNDLKSLVVAGYYDRLIGTKKYKEWVYPDSINYPKHRAIYRAQIARPSKNAAADYAKIYEINTEIVWSQNRFFSNHSDSNVIRFSTREIQFNQQ